MVKTINATAITGQTLVGSSGEFPRDRGNCFSVRAKRKEYRIVNFNVENLEHLLEEKGLRWPVAITPLCKNVAVLNDARIGDRWYQTKFCEACCPRHLLPMPQQLNQARSEARGARTYYKSGGISWVSENKTILPKIL
jgi:hypothetical protein